MPLTPSRTFFQPSATVLPQGEIKPRPVTTTRRLDTVGTYVAKKGMRMMAGNQTGLSLALASANVVDRVLEDGEIHIRAKDPAYANPGPDEAQKF